MNKGIASFVFSGETLFHLKEEQIPTTKEAIPVLNTPVIPPTPTKKRISKQILVLVNAISETDQDFLSKILASVNVTTYDLVALENFNEYDFSALENTKEIICFGDFNNPVNFSDNGLKYQVVQQKNYKTLKADALNTIALNTQNEKKNLWNALKTLFQI